MKDVYPAYDSVPADWLVPPAAQPEYLRLSVPDAGDELNLTDCLVDRQVREGRGDHVAVHLAEDGGAHTYAQLSDQAGRLHDALLDAAHAEDAETIVMKTLAEWAGSGQFPAQARVF